MFKSLFFSSIVLFSAAASSEASLIISEILADPPSGIAGDANSDGTGSTSQDEFVEFFNNSLISFDISSWYLSDALAIRHVFPSGTIVNADEYLVVFGGGAFVSTTLKQKASTGGLSLNNTGDSIRLFNAGGIQVEEVIYDGLAGHDQSIVRATPSASEDFVLHSGVLFYENKPYSPGYGVDNSAVAVPEPLSFSLLGAGLAGFGFLRRRKYRTNA